jgi:hypothetical protein
LRPLRYRRIHPPCAESAIRLAAAAVPRPFDTQDDIRIRVPFGPSRIERFISFALGLLSKTFFLVFAKHTAPYDAIAFPMIPA